MCHWLFWAIHVRNLRRPAVARVLARRSDPKRLEGNTPLAEREQGQNLLWAPRKFVSNKMIEREKQATATCLWRIVSSPMIPQDSPVLLRFCDAPDRRFGVLIHFVAILARLLGSGGVRSIVAESPHPQSLIDKLRQVCSLESANQLRCKFISEVEIRLVSLSKF
jgi:hypothetical protein